MWLFSPVTLSLGCKPSHGLNLLSHVWNVGGNRKDCDQDVPVSSRTVPPVAFQGSQKDKWKRLSWDGSAWQLNHMAKTSMIIMWGTRISYDQRSHQYHLDKDVSDWISEKVQRIHIARLQSTAQDKLEGNRAEHTAQKLQAESKEFIEIKHKSSY